MKILLIEPDKTPVVIGLIRKEIIGFKIGLEIIKQRK